MSARLIALPFRPTINLQGGIEAGAKLEVYQSGGLTPVSIYSDDALTIELANPLTANAVGAFPDVYWDDATAIRVILKTADGVVLSDTDPYIATAAEAQAILDDATAVVAAAAVSANDAQDSADAAAASALAADASADAAAASAASAVLAPGTSGTSTSTHDVGTGNKSFFFDTAKQFARGQFVVVTANSDPTRWMFGQITNNAAGAIKVDVEVLATSLPLGGNYSSWTVALSGPSGSIGVVDIVSSTSGTLTVARGGTGSTTASDARTALGLGTIATQAANNVSITGGSIGGVSGVTTTSGGILRSTSGGLNLDVRQDGSNGSVTSSNSLLLYAGGATNMIFHTDGVSRMRITATGNVGIGTNSPSERLHVAGNIRDTLGNVRQLVKSSETSGTLTVASANQVVRASGNVTIPASVFAANDTVMIINKSGGSITLTQGAGLTLTNTAGATGNRTLANNGVVTVWFNSATDAHIFGAGLT